MQWTVIFENESLKHDFNRLSRRQKMLLFSAYLYRQVGLINEFDSLYSENLSTFFTEVLCFVVVEDKEKLRNIVEVIDGRIPDADEFSEQEGSYAQNLIIALRYLICFLLRIDESGLQKCVDMSLQNIDLINYDVDESYDEAEVVAREAKIIAVFVERVIRYAYNKVCDIDTVKNIVGSDWV